MLSSRCHALNHSGKLQKERKKRGGEEKVRAKKPPRTEGCTRDTERGLRAFNPPLRGDGKHRVKRRDRAKIERARKTTFMQFEGRSSFCHSDPGRTSSPPSLHPSVLKPAAATCLVTGCSLRIKRAIVREHSSQQPVKPQEPPPPDDSGKNVCLRILVSSIPSDGVRGWGVWGVNF